MAPRTTFAERDLNTKAILDRAWKFSRDLRIMKVVDETDVPTSVRLAISIRRRFWRCSWENRRSRLWSRPQWGAYCARQRRCGGR